jgi:hypothetical protein
MEDSVSDSDSDSDSQSPERNFEKLSKAITEAVMKSEKVRKIVTEIQKNDHICPQSFMVLVLKMDALADSDSEQVEIEDDLSENIPPQKCEEKKKPKEQVEYIDGRKLTKNEIKFQEFIKDQFDTENWLRKNGLIL